MTIYAGIWRDTSAHDIRYVQLTAKSLTVHLFTHIAVRLGYIIVFLFRKLAGSVYIKEIISIDTNDILVIFILQCM